MSFKVFIYYCALCGGWAAFLAWAVCAIFGVTAISNPLGQTVAIAAVLGVTVAASVGLMDAMLNAVGMQRLVRVMLCSLLGLVGGALGGLLGGLLYLAIVGYSPLLALGVRFFGWLLVGILIGGAVGVFDLVRAMTAGESPGGAIRKVINGLVGGFIGGALGGLPFTVISASQFLTDTLPNARLAFGLVLLGGCIGLMVGLAQVILKQAWLKVEEGFRPGRELMLMKEETTIGRSEACDLGLYADNTIEKTHAKILKKNNRYWLSHAAEGGETLLNDQALGQKPVALKDGDMIRIGRSLLRFGEREKRRG